MPTHLRTPCHTHSHALPPPTHKPIHKHTHTRRWAHHALFELVFLVLYQWQVGGGGGVSVSGGGTEGGVCKCQPKLNQQGGAGEGCRRGYGIEPYTPETPLQYPRPQTHPPHSRALPTHPRLCSASFVCLGWYSQPTAPPTHLPPQVMYPHTEQPQLIVIHFVFLGFICGNLLDAVQFVFHRYGSLTQFRK